MRSMSFLKNASAFLFVLLFSISVNAGETTVVLQDGLDGYDGTKDNYLSYWHHNHSFHNSNVINNHKGRWHSLVQFSVFEAEGGVVPNGAEIVSATLSLYKKTHYNFTWNAQAVKASWNPEQATWKYSDKSTDPKVEWSELGGAGVGTDLRNNAQQLASTGWNPEWVTWDVTADLNNWANGLENKGWQIVGISGNNNLKRFWSSEYADDASLRPKLTITYKPKKVILQNGVDGYEGNTDASMYSYHSGHNYNTRLYSKNFGWGNTPNPNFKWTTIHRFDIFQSEGGLVNNSATIVSASFNLYKLNPYNFSYSMNRLLKGWDEALVTWNEATPGDAWNEGGAWGLDSDISSTADGSVTTGWANGYQSIDVTSGVVAFQGGQTNYGWHMLELGGNNNIKKFATSEDEDVSIRPNLCVEYYLSNGDLITPELPLE